MTLKELETRVVILERLVAKLESQLAERNGTSPKESQAKKTIGGGKRLVHLKMTWALKKWSGSASNTESPFGLIDKSSLCFNH